MVGGAEQAVVALRHKMGMLEQMLVEHGVQTRHWFLCPQSELALLKALPCFQVQLKIDALTLNLHLSQTTELFFFFFFCQHFIKRPYIIHESRTYG
jgi:hypothetical protein